jgi:uncharacterized protein (TIGR03437 family)
LLCVLQCTAQTHLEEYALILEDAPIARRIASRAPIQIAQQNLRRELARRKIPVSGSAQTLLNAVFVRVPRARLAELQSLPEVKRVVWSPRMKRNLNLALGLVNVTSAWTALPGGSANAGAGVKIAIIDSGIDLTSPAFQDNSLAAPSGFPKGDTAYTNKKVIVARNYESMFLLPDDPTPRDRSGHGTALAMIAAGQTSQAPLATITGVAPMAWLGNYKIFGSPGVNDTTLGSIVVAALEDAYTDGMNIAVLAFGYPAVYGPLDGSDVSAQAVENAVASGMTVVVSAGNDAQTSAQPPALNSIDSPGTAPSAITVGASTNAHVLFAAVEVNGAAAPSNLQTLDALVGDGPKLVGPLSGPLLDVSSVDATGLACTPLTAGSFTGAMVLIQRGNCDFSTKINNAQQAGATAVVLYQSDATAAPFSSLGAENTGIPAVMIGNADGLALKSYLASNANTHITLDPALHVEVATSNLVAGFSSRGPSIDYAIKPELVAVGQGIYTATETLDPSGDLYDPSGFTTVDGSSFAAAMVAGAAALVLQQNPGFTAGQVKSALVNTASPGPAAIVDDSDSGEPLISAVGAGKLNALEALAPGATVEPATVSFGLAGPGSAPGAITLTITNVASSTATFALTVAPDSTEVDSSDQIVVSPASLKLAAGQTGIVTVSLTGSFPVAGTYDGAIDITGPGTNLSVPYWYLVSDGVPFDILPVIDSSFFGAVNNTCQLIAFKVVDQYGVALPGVPVEFSAPGGGAVSTSCASDTQTDSYGIAEANVDLGSTPGDQSFEGAAGGLNTFFNAFVRPVPVISANGVVDAASSRVGKGLAPGSYVAIYGTALSDATAALSTPFLPFGMSGVSVSFTTSDGSGSWPGRLWYVSPAQINVQIPWELQGHTPAMVTVSIDGISSAPYTLPISDDLPAMYEYNRLAIAQDATYQLITAANPALRGQTIIVYANGLGAVNNTPPSGEATPPQPLAETLATPTVTIGGVSAKVLFSGLTPDSIALYQIDVTVPQDAPTGPQQVVITENGVSSQPANIPVQ